MNYSNCDVMRHLLAYPVDLVQVAPFDGHDYSLYLENYTKRDKWLSVAINLPMTLSVFYKDDLADMVDFVPWREI